MLQFFTCLFVTLGWLITIAASCLVIVVILLAANYLLTPKVQLQDGDLTPPPKDWQDTQ
jgi:hypothetical protein